MEQTERAHRHATMQTHKRTLWLQGLWLILCKIGAQVAKSAIAAERLPRKFKNDFLGNGNCNFSKLIRTEMFGGEIMWVVLVTQNLRNGNSNSQTKSSNIYCPETVTVTFRRLIPRIISSVSNPFANNCKRRHLCGYPGESCAKYSKRFSVEEDRSRSALHSIPFFKHCQQTCC